MSQVTAGNTRQFTAGAALEPYRRVKLDGSNANQVVYAGLNEAAIGETTQRIASGEKGPIQLHFPTRKYVAGAAIAVNALVYSLANGKIDDVSTSAGAAIGWALEAATADGDEIEVLVRRAETA